MASLNTASNTASSAKLDVSPTKQLEVVTLKTTPTLIFNDEVLSKTPQNNSAITNANTISNAENNKSTHKTSSTNKSPANSNNLMRPYSVPNAKASTTPKLTIKSSSSDHDDILENILEATDRRASWQNVRSVKSYVPSLTAICKCF